MPINAATPSPSADRTSVRAVLNGKSAAPPHWTRWYEAFDVIVYPPYLKRTLRVALIIGSILFAVNHLDEVIAGHATRLTWLKGIATCCVPFCVSNFGVLIATRRLPNSHSEDR